MGILRNDYGNARRVCGRGEEEEPIIALLRLCCVPDVNVCRRFSASRSYPLAYKKVMHYIRYINNSTTTVQPNDGVKCGHVWYVCEQRVMGAWNIDR